MLVVEQIAVDRADAGDQPVGRRPLAQPLDGATRALRGDDERAEFHERAVIKDVVDVLARRALAGLAPARDRVRAVLVEDVGAPLVELLQVGADVVEIELLGLLDRAALHLGLFDEDEREALAYHVAGGHGDTAHDAAAVGGDDVFHLHRLDHGELLALAHLVALGDVDREDRALDRGRDADRTVGAGEVRGGLLGRRRRRSSGLDRGVVREERERVAAVDLGAGEPPVGGLVRAGGHRHLDEATADTVAGDGEFRDLLVDEARVHAALEEVGVREHVLQEGDVRRDAVDPKLAEGARGPRHRVREVRGRRVADHLREQRIERGAGLVAGVAEAVGADTGAAGRLVGGERAARGANGAVLGERLHVHARLDRVSARLRDPRIVEAQLRDRGARGEADLRLHDVDAGDLLGHGVLDLEPRVRLDEDEGLAAVPIAGVDEELEGAEVGVADAVRESQRRLDDLAAQRVRQVGRGSDLHDLLVAALDAALALAEVGDRAVLVAEDLHLDVPGARDHLLHVEIAVAEGAERLGATALVGGLDVVGVGDGAGAAATAAGDGLDHHRAARAERCEELPGLVERHGAVGAPEHRDASGCGGRARARLVAKQLQHLDRGADERDAGLRAAAREGGVFGEEAVAGVEGVAARLPRDLDHPLDVEVGRHAPSGERPRLVRDAGVQRLGVVLGVDRDGADTEVGRGTDDADSDFAAICDEQTLEAHIDSSTACRGICTD